MTFILLLFSHVINQASWALTNFSEISVCLWRELGRLLAY